MADTKVIFRITSVDDVDEDFAKICGKSIPPEVLAVKKENETLCKV